MKVLFDIYHLPHINFFKNAIRSIGPENVVLSSIDRGKLIDIVKFEFPEYKLYEFGSYKYNKGPISIIFFIILPRILKLIWLIRKEKVNKVMTVGYQANIAAGLLGRESFNFTDDPRTFHLKIIKKFASQVYIPAMNIGDDKVNEYDALKEWAYLSPSYFHPDHSILDEYGIKPYKYIFIREVSTKTINYLGQNDGLVLSVADKIKGRVILSLENKEKADQYPSDWLLLKEPIKDIHSLIYYSKLLLSSGDSMAREAGMLGVPSIYLGMRTMPANEKLVRENRLKKVSIDDFEKEFKTSYNDVRSYEEQEKLRYDLEKRWVDVTRLILKLIKDIKK